MTIENQFYQEFVVPGGQRVMALVEYEYSTEYGLAYTKCSVPTVKMSDTGRVPKVTDGYEMLDITDLCEEKLVEQYVQAHADDRVRDEQVGTRAYARPGDEYR